MGIQITDEFLKLSGYIDRVEDRPWSMLYSENYFNEVFTEEMARRLTGIWDKISGKVVIFVFDNSNLLKYFHLIKSGKGKILKLYYDHHIKTIDLKGGPTLFEHTLGLVADNCNVSSSSIFNELMNLSY